MKKLLLTLLALLCFAMAAPSAWAADTAICYNCPPMWADWASQLQAIEDNLGISMPHDNKNSGQTLSQLIAEKDNPVADVAYYGVSFGIKAKEEGVVQAYKPQHWEDIPAGLKDDDRYWFTIPKQTSYARVISGEIPILFDYDFNAYRGKYKDQANIEFVIPAEGSIVVPYVMSLVKDCPHPEKGKKILDFIMSDTGQAVWANAFLRPVRPKALTPETAAKFLPDSEYQRAKPIDYKKMAEVQNTFRDRYLAEVR